MEINWKIHWHQVVISVLIGFALGTVFGQRHGEESWRAHWKKGSKRQEMVERFSKELHLSADQKNQVAAIFEAKHPQMEILRDEMKPKFEALRASTQAEIRKLLTPEQEKKFDEMNAKMEERWKERRKFFDS